MATAIFKGGEIQEYLADVVTSEDHNLSSQVSHFAMETGARRSDHIIFNPDEVTISFELSNQNNDGDELGDRAARLYESLRNAYLSRDLYDVVTRHFLYQSMVIANVRATQSGPFQGRLVASVLFKQFDEIQLSTITIPEGRLEDGYKKTASSSTDAV
ncbi:hypothetical protein F9L16_24065 [Agarivorans sp. B2Z047]|uniref:phage baseplate protein n=1 Tax=Agarivorans sp. B2Z047 TaxID=2652721 RepID=UPI00128D0250|nr:hypothetical protein [Agarivorans sp. B2Z047]MPW32024.1 hypothetical protein [Agarivorans sp. B2Z047]UQN41875.1 hypothetical protein LQZ07_19165 [Agarivorans sp. B2Z047]